ncbi:MAG: PorT family protein [Gemmatimonadetes bacterium]|nr:PorT family protein [Gemmatimonadota bacterium]
MKLAQAVLCLCTVAIGGIQTASAQVMTFGLSGGVSLADASVELDGSSLPTDGRKSFDFGGFVGLQFSPVLAMQLEGHVTGRGFRLTQQATGLTPGVNAVYFDIPLHAVFSMPGGGGNLITPRFFAGPLLAFRMSCTPQDIVMDPTLPNECQLDVAKQVDFGVSLGGGVKIGRGAGGLLLEVSYRRGFVNVSKSTTMDANIKNHNIVLSLGFIVPTI